MLNSRSQNNLNFKLEDMDYKKLANEYNNQTRRLESILLFLSLRDSFREEVLDDFSINQVISRLDNPVSLSMNSINSKNFPVEKFEKSKDIVNELVKYLNKLQPYRAFVGANGETGLTYKEALDTF